MTRVAGMVVLGMIAGYSLLVILGRMSARLDVPEAVPICFTLAVGFLTVVSSLNAPSARRSSEPDARSAEESRPASGVSPVAASPSRSAKGVPGGRS